MGTFTGLSGKGRGGGCSGSSGSGLPTLLDAEDAGSSNMDETKPDCCGDTDAACAGEVNCSLGATQAFFSYCPGGAGLAEIWSGKPRGGDSAGSIGVTSAVISSGGANWSREIGDSGEGSESGSDGLEIPSPRSGTKSISGKAV